MKTESINAFNLGLSLRTTNENGQAFQDIPALWQQFMSQNIAALIPNRTEPAIYCLYTHYELDHTKPYTVIIGCKVSTLDEIPEGLTGGTFQSGTYVRRTAKGDLQKGAVVKEWQNIWAANLPRKFTADFEVYGEKAQDPGNAEVDIFIAV
ncbi:GyrI-like domain-containing protein [Chitinophaga niabensis]|uniref:GyrI-like domain-containing protein n=1 Tax=Chitinophaga niabensis TaxID=536979 RepID=UPI0031BAFA5F